MTNVLKPSRWPIRVRLTVLYAASFLAAGAVIVTITYVLVSQALIEPEATARFENLVDRPGLDLPSAEAIRDAIEAYRQDTLNSLLTWSLIVLAAAFVLAVVLGWVLAGRALRSLQRVTDTARRVADRNLHERIALTGPDDEIKQLADTIDAMLERLDRSFDAQRRFVANASHELRTPLAVNRTLLEVALGEPEVSADLRQVGSTVLVTNERSERLVEGLLTLARSEQEVTERAPVDLADLVPAAIRHESGSDGEPSQHDVTFTLDLAPAFVVGSPLLLEQLVVNLVQNALRHAASATTATIRTAMANGHAVLELENAGPVIGKHEVEGLFEPFRRGNGRTAEARGVGLGLSIVRSVAIAHGGSVQAWPRDGGGLKVRVELPADLSP